MPLSRYCLALAAAAGLCTATNLYVASYDGNITTLDLTSSNGSYSLKATYKNDGCAPNPSWLNLDQPRGILYCADEGLSVTNGTLSSFSVASDGKLSLVHKQNTISGPVSSGSAVSSFTLAANGSFSFLQDETFKLAKPGPNAARQDAPHEHEAILDPTGQFLLVPDLGADLVRVFSTDSSLKATALTPLTVAPGSGPRHAVFWTPDGVTGGTSPTFLYVVAELGQTVTGYSVSYPSSGGLAFKQVYTSKTYGSGSEPAGTAPAEITISPDNRFLLISNRNDTAFNIDSPSGGSEKSDSISTFKLNRDGSLSFTQLWPAGGSYPRQFSINKYGDLVAVGLQLSARVSILSRDVETGKLGEAVASITVPGNITCVVWDE
ncbi:MAG: hypothetical protein M1820_003735 [Bogoriella megaspora]|nr:MAG: hypothetical protein M1820_003735 [Bogoriella megaspora]